ncbi:MAG: hypothetical protein K0R10_2307 [Alphaproteobacteria bacterium]|nr:hypothetical protein [Alphaproteobacteria bacterium]
MLQRVMAKAEKPQSSQKNFHLNVILSLLTGMTLSREGEAGPQRLVAFLLDEQADACVTMENAETVRQGILEQLPFLNDINFDSLHEIMRVDPSPTNPYINVWREMQALQYGEEHALVPLSRWQKKSDAA